MPRGFHDQDTRHPGFLDLYGADISYFDPATAVRIDGHETMVSYYSPWTGKIRIFRYDMLSPRVVVEGSMALLTYNLVNYIRDADGVEAEGTRWNSTVHSHWSFTRHPAIQNTSPAAAEGLEE